MIIGQNPLLTAEQLALLWGSKPFEETIKQIRHQNKRGFVVPLAAWFRGDLQRYAREILLSPDVERRGYLDTNALERGSKDNVTCVVVAFDRE